MDTHQPGQGDPNDTSGSPAPPSPLTPDIAPSSPDPAHARWSPEVEKPRATAPPPPTPAAPGHEWAPGAPDAGKSGGDIPALPASTLAVPAAPPSAPGVPGDAEPHGGTTGSAPTPAEPVAIPETMDSAGPSIRERVLTPEDTWAPGTKAAEAAARAFAVRPSEPTGPRAAGVIQSIEDEDAVVVLEDGRTARMRKVDLADAQGKIHAEIGDRVEGTLLEGEPLRLKKRSARAEAIAALADTFTTKTPVEGRVTHSVKGGFEVRVNGVRAFCPSSQLSLRRDDIQGDPVGQTFTFVLTKWDAEGRSLVVSRRKLLERDQKRQAAGARERIRPGATLTGRVVGFQPYGAFIDLGGVQGLLHVSEMGHGRVQDPKAVLSMGQEVDVVVLKHDEGFKKVSLSRKPLEKDPWKEAGDSLQAGQVRKAVSKRVTSVGAFLEIAPGIEGLLPAAVPSEAADELPAAGAEVLVRIAELEPRRHRITLMPAPEGSADGDAVEAPAIEKGARIDGLVDHVVPFGVFVRLGHRKTGLLHASESKVPQGEDLVAAFPVGARVKVEVLDVSEDGQKIRLSRKTPGERALMAAQRSMASAPRGEMGEPRGGGRGEERGGGGFGRDDRGPRRGGPPPGERRSGGPRPPRPGGGPGGAPAFGSDRGGPRGERRPRREGGGEPIHNPAAAPRTGFAVIGDAFRAKLMAMAAKNDPAAEDETPTEAPSVPEAPSVSETPPEPTAPEQPGEASDGSEDRAPSE